MSLGDDRRICNPRVAAVRLSDPWGIPCLYNAILRLLAATLAPIVSLALTMMPLEELLKMLFGMLI